MSDATLRAFSAEAKTRADRTMNDYIYAFDLHGKTTLYASDLAKVIADRDDLLAALESLVAEYMPGVEADFRYLSTEGNHAQIEQAEYDLKKWQEARAAIAKARGQS